MQRKLRTRTRLAAALVLSAAGGLLVAGSAVPAQADCVRVSVWTYSNKDKWKPVVEDYCVPYSDIGWNETVTPDAGHGEDVSQVPEGWPVGVAFEIGIPQP